MCSSDLRVEIVRGGYDDPERSPAFSDLLDGVEKLGRTERSDFSRRWIRHDTIFDGLLIHFSEYSIQQCFAIVAVFSCIHGFVVENGVFRIDERAVGDFVTDSDILTRDDVRIGERPYDFSLRSSGALRDLLLLVPDIDRKDDIFDTDAKSRRENEFGPPAQFREGSLDRIAGTFRQNFLLREEFVRED